MKDLKFASSGSAISAEKACLRLSTVIAGKKKIVEENLSEAGKYVKNGLLSSHVTPESTYQHQSCLAESFLEKRSQLCRKVCRAAFCILLSHAQKPEC